MSLSCEMIEGLDFLNLNTTSMMSASILFVYRSQYDNDKLRNEFMNLDVAGLQRLTGQKVNIWAGRVPSQTVLYVPTGFLLCEHCREGTLFYGVRRSSIFLTDSSLSKFKKLIEIEKKQGKEVAKTEKLLESMQKAAQQAEK